MELKRATELTICSLLKEALPDLSFYPAKGGGDDVTPTWQSNHDYQVGDILRPTNSAFIHMVVVTVGGNSGPTEPAFTDVIGSQITGIPTYLTTAETIVSAKADSANVIPPFATVMFEPSEKTMGQEDTDIMHGILVWVTRQEVTNVVDHSGNFKRIYDALSQIEPGYDIKRRITVHGVDISSSTEFSDGEREAHGDVIEFIVGITAKPAQV
jgi:hypothetical protein